MTTRRIFERKIIRSIVLVQEKLWKLCIVSSVTMHPPKIETQCFRHRYYKVNFFALSSRLLNSIKKVKMKCKKLGVSRTFGALIFRGIHDTNSINANFFAFLLPLKYNNKTFYI